MCARATCVCASIVYGDDTIGYAIRPTICVEYSSSPGIDQMEGTNGINSVIRKTHDLGKQNRVPKI